MNRASPYLPIHGLVADEPLPPRQYRALTGSERTTGRVREAKAEADVPRLTTDAENKGRRTVRDRERHNTTPGSSL